MERSLNSVGDKSMLDMVKYPYTETLYTNVRHGAKEYKGTKRFFVIV